MSTSTHNINFFQVRAARLSNAMQLSGEQSVSVRYGAEQYDWSACSVGCVAERELVV